MIMKQKYKYNYKYFEKVLKYFQKKNVFDPMSGLRNKVVQAFQVNLTKEIFHNYVDDFNKSRQCTHLHRVKISRIHHLNCVRM